MAHKFSIRMTGQYAVANMTGLPIQKVDFDFLQFPIVILSASAT